MKVLVLILFSIFFITNAMETIDEFEDTDSPVVSYLMDKIQQLEGKLMAKSNERSTREVEKRAVDTNTSADDKKVKGCNCPQQVVTYIRWGNSTCPYGANTVYQGTAVGGHYSHKGSPSNMLCLPPDPMRPLNNQGGSYYAYGVEYQTGGPINHVDDRNMPCSLCEVIGRDAKIMIPSHYLCPAGWHKEYSGYIMAGHHNQEGSTMYNCIDDNLEQIKGTGSEQGGHWLYTIYTTGSYIPYDSGYALTCVVCTK